MNKCNECARDECNIYKKIKGYCSSYIPLEKFTTPLLVHLMSDKRKVKEVIELLDKSNIKLSETYKYPYFKLEMV